VISYGSSAAELTRTTQTIGLADGPEIVTRIFQGKVQGRTVVDVSA